jgi:hypothetical protein
MQPDQQGDGAVVADARRLGQMRARKGRLGRACIIGSFLRLLSLIFA